MKRGSMQAILLVAFGAASMLLQGCDFGSGTENCNGEDCSCSWTFHSFWARIHISDIHIEHAARVFYVPDVAKDVPNASVSACCSAIFDQIDYDEGKTASMPNKSVDSFNNSCASSPNKEVANASQRGTPAASGHHVIGASKLYGLRKATSAPHQAHLQDDYQPIPDGEQGQDCEVSTTDHAGFPLNNVMITSGSMKLRIKWADPDAGPTPCCDTLQPILDHMYLKRLPESMLPSDIKTSFCNSCKTSPNQGIALAAYRCFGAKEGVDVAV